MCVPTVNTNFETGRRQADPRYKSANIWIFFFGTNSILYASNLHRKLSVQYVYKIEMK
jgi:hypothetical protein